MININKEEVILWLEDNPNMVFYEPELPRGECCLLAKFLTYRENEPFKVLYTTAVPVSLVHTWGSWRGLSGVARAIRVMSDSLADIKDNQIDQPTMLSALRML